MEDGRQERVQFRRRLCLQPPHGIHLRLYAIEIIHDAPLFERRMSRNTKSKSFCLSSTFPI